MNNIQLLLFKHQLNKKDMKNNMLIEINKDDLDRIKIPFRIYRIHTEKRKTIIKTRELFKSNPTKEFKIKEVHKKVCARGRYSYRTIARLLVILEKEGFLTSELKKQRRCFVRFYRLV